MARGVIIYPERATQVSAFQRMPRMGVLPFQQQVPVQSSTYLVEASEVRAIR